MPISLSRFELRNTLNSLMSLASEIGMGRNATGWPTISVRTLGAGKYIYGIRESISLYQCFVATGAAVSGKRLRARSQSPAVRRVQGAGPSTLPNAMAIISMEHGPRRKESCMIDHSAFQCSGWAEIKSARPFSVIWWYYKVGAMSMCGNTRINIKNSSFSCASLGVTKFISFLCGEIHAEALPLSSVLTAVDPIIPCYIAARQSIVGRPLQ